MERATRGAAMSSSTCPRWPVIRMLSWCWSPKAPRGIDAPPIAPIAPLSNRTAMASCSSTAVPGDAVNAATALARSDGTRRSTRPMAWVSWRLPVAAARTSPAPTTSRRAAAGRRRRRDTWSRSVSRSRTIVAIWTSTCSTSPIPSGPSISAAGGGRDPHLVPGVAQHDVPAALPRQRIDRPGVGRIDRERLLGEDVAARLERGTGLLGAERPGPGQGHDVRAGSDDVVPVGRGVGEAEPLAHLGELGLDRGD